MAESGKHVGAIDLGGTKIYSAVLDADGRVIGADLRPTDSEKGQSAVLDRLVASLNAASSSAGIQVRSLLGVGIAAPGPVDPRTGHLSDPPNLPGWRDVPLGPILSERFGLRVVVENDANAAALGEYANGSGRGAATLVYTTISTGIGGGLVFNGSLHRGATGAAGELGHMIIEPDGPRCSCGHSGCLEALASGTAMMRAGRAVLAAGHAPVLRRLVEEAGGEITTELVAQAALDGDQESADIIRRAGAALGIGLGNLVNILDPDVIVVGGGAANIGTPLLGPAETTMRATILAKSAGHVQIRRAALEYAAIAGVAELVRSS